MYCIGIAQGFFEVIDYRYRFSTERFILPITGHDTVTLIECAYAAGPGAGLKLTWSIVLDPK